MDVLAVTPSYIFPPNFWIWTVFTYPLIEASILLVVFDIICIYLSAKLVEPLWGLPELLKYYAIVGAFVGLLTSVVYLLFYVWIASDTDTLFNARIAGFSGINGAISVAVKQLLPDQTILSTPLARIKHTHLTSWLCIIVGILAALQLVPAYSFAMFTIGAFVGWIYLRFYQPHPNGSRGDQGEHMSFARCVFMF